MWLKCGGRRREAGDMAGEVAGDRSGGACGPWKIVLILFLVQWAFMQKSEM